VLSTPTSGAASRRMAYFRFRLSPSGKIKGLDIGQAM
jgi:hypothetical protein